MRRVLGIAGEAGTSSSSSWDHDGRQTESTDMSSREPDESRELRDRDDEPSFFTLPLIFPHSDMTPAKDYYREYAGKKNNRRGSVVSRSCGDQSTTNVLRSELDYSTGNIFVLFIFRRGLLLILLN